MEVDTHPTTDAKKDQATLATPQRRRSTSRQARVALVAPGYTGLATVTAARDVSGLTSQGLYNAILQASDDANPQGIDNAILSAKGNADLRPDSYEGVSNTPGLAEVVRALPEGKPSCSKKETAFQAV